MIKKSFSKNQAENFQKHYRAGTTAFKENNFEKAHEFFTKVIIKIYKVKYRYTLYVMCVYVFFRQ